MKEKIEMENLPIKEDDLERRVSEAFFSLHDLLAERIGNDGELLLINEGNNHYIIDQTGWREVLFAENDFLDYLSTIDSIQIINDLSKIDNQVTAFITQERDTIHSLAITPIQTERLDAYLLVWKETIDEQYQVMVPLMVGSEMIGMTSQVKKKSLENDFPENVEELLSEALPEIEKLSLSIKSAILQKKESLYEGLENISSDKTVKEVSKILIGQLMEISLSTNRIRNLLQLIKRDLKNREVSYENALLIESLLESMDQNVLKAIFSTDQNNLTQNILEGKSNTFTQTFFENLLYPYMIRACEENRDIVCYVNPKISKELVLDLKATHSFINSFIYYLFDRSLMGKKIYFNIIRSRQGAGLFLEVITEGGGPEENYRLQALINAKDTPSSLRILYDTFLRSGGTLQFRNDTKHALKVYSIYIPAESVSNEPLFSIVIPDETKIGFLIDLKKDYIYANNMSRYLFTLGLSREQFIAAEDDSIIYDDSLTHLVIFESKFDKELFREKLKSTNLSITIVKEGCFRDSNLTFYDFSHIDMEMFKVDKYLRKIEEFLILGGLR